MINLRVAEEDVRTIDSYIRDLSTKMQDGLTAEQVVMEDYSSVFHKTKEEAFVFVQDILAAKKDYELNKEMAAQELPEQYLENFITVLFSNPAYTLSQKYQILAMAKAYFLKISCISLGDALLKEELSISFETAMLAVEAEFSDRMRHADNATQAELDALYEETLLASEAALVLPHPLEIAQTILEYTEQSILTEPQQQFLTEKREQYLFSSYSLYKAVLLGKLTMHGLSELQHPEFAEELLAFLCREALASADLTELVQDIRGGRTTLEKAQSLIRIIVSVLLGAVIAGLLATVTAGVAALITEVYLSFGVFAGTVTLIGILASLLANSEDIADFIDYLCHTAAPQITVACQIAAKRLSVLISQHSSEKQEAPEEAETTRRESNKLTDDTSSIISATSPADEAWNESEPAQEDPLYN